MPLSEASPPVHVCKGLIGYIPRNDLKEAALKKQAYFEKQNLEPIDSKRGEVIHFRQAQNE